VNKVIAEATIAKVLGRWAPHARHDLVGAWTPMSMDLAVLAAKNAKTGVTSEDLSTFIARMKDSLKHVSLESDNVALMVGQDRKATVQVGEAVRDIAQKLRPRYGAVEYVLSDPPDKLGEEIRYDLYMALLAALMALEDRRGTSVKLILRAERDGAGRLTIYITSQPMPNGENAWAQALNAAYPQRRIDFVDVDCLASYLGFRFIMNPDGGELRRLEPGER